MRFLEVLVFVLAVTGGIGSGKSTAAEAFARRGAVVIELDDVAKRLLDDAAPVRERVAEAFGPEVFGVDGRADRAALSEAAFASPESARALNAIVHPAVYAAVVGALSELASLPEPPCVVVLVVPLLAEAPEFLDLVDVVLAISAREDARVARAIARGMSAEEVERRTSLQAGDSERREIADHVLENDGTPAEFENVLAAFWEAEIAPRQQAPK
jgi:dephospho-CoA kinase